MSDAPGNPGTSIEFRLGSGATFPARALASRLVDDVVELTIEVGPEQWSMIDMVMLFHLEWSNRHEGELVEGGDVQLELRLDHELVGELQPLVDPDDATGVTIAAVVAGLDGDHPLLDPQSWYALRVTEAVPLPPDLADKGEVRSGFTTVWAD